MLQPDKLKKLNENAAKMSQAGSSQEEIMAMRDAFIKQFGNEEPLKKKVSSELPKPQAPKAGTTELPSEDGSLVTPPTKKTFATTDMSGKSLFPEQKEFGKALKKGQAENKALESEKKKYGDIFDKQLNIKPKVDENQYLKDRLSSVNTELIDREEEYVVPQLKYQFGDLGFNFEESGATGDYVKVTAPNGKTTEISLDNFSSSKSKSESEVLQKFIKDNTPTKGLFVLEKTMREQDKKFNSEKQVDDSVKVISNEVNALNAKQKEFLIKKSSFEKDLINLGATPELEQRRLALNEEMKSILQEEETIKQKGNRLSTAVGKYSISKSKQGTWGGALANAINEGFSSIAAGTTSLATDIATEIAPTGFGMSPKDLRDVSINIANKIGAYEPRYGQTIEQWKATLTEDQLDKWEDEVDDYIKKDIKARALPLIRIGNREIFGDADTTKQFSDLKEKGFWGGAILGVAKSLPAMIGSTNVAGWAQRTAQMYAQISDALAVEMENDPSFKNISENEKLAITLPIGITSAVLEAYGLRNVMASKGVINSITLSVLGKAGVGASAKTFRELVENEVESKIARGLLTVTAAGVAEFETGAAQEATETGFKVLYDKIKGEDMFDTPDSKIDLVENILVAGAQEAVGGFVLGVPSGVSAAYAKKGFLKMDDASFEMFANMANDEKMQSAYITSLKEKITQGIITEKEAKEQLNNYRNSAGLYRQLPEGLSIEQQKEAMNLLKEKRDLENFVSGKDAALVLKQKNRITEINNSLTKLSETDAIQEQATDESVLRTKQPELGLQEMGEGDTKPGEVTEETITTAQPQEVIQDEISQPIELSVPSATATQPEEVKGTFLDNILDKIYEYEDPITGGKLKGNVFFDGQEVVFTDGYKEFSLGTVQDALSSNSLNATEITPTFNISEDGTIDILQETEGIPKGKITPQGAGLKAIKTDKNGNVKRVVITDANGITHSVKGELANELADFMMLDLAKKGGLIRKINSDETTRETFNRGVREAGAKRKSKDTQTGVQRLDGGRRVEEAPAAKTVAEVVTEPAPVVESEEAPVSKPVQTKAEQIISQIDKAIQALFDKNGPDIDTWGTGPDNSNLIALKRAKKALQTDAKTFKTFLDTPMGKRYSEMSAKFEDANELKKIKSDIEVSKERLKKVQREVNKTAGVKPKPTEQKRINKAYAVGIATQRVVTDAVKADVKDLKGQVVDVFRAGIEAVKIAQTTAKEKARDIKIKSEELAKYLDELKGKGKITATQASSMVKRFSKVNVLSEKSVNRFIDYATKVLNDADYSSKLTEARKTLSSIKKLSKNADKNPDLRAVGIEFSKIEPSMLENIEDYNDIASKLETAIDGSKIRGKNTNIVDTVNIDEVSSYIEKTLAEQEKKLQQEKIDEIQDLFGVDASEFSAEEIDALLESDKDLSKDNEKVVRAAIKKAFDIYSTVIKDMLETKIDSFTGEDVEFTKQEQELIERFMNIDPNTIKDPKEALRTVDSLINFIQNKSTAGMLKPIADNDAIVGGKEAVRQGLISKKLRKYWIPSVGRFFGEKTTSLPVLFEKMFKGVTRALKVEELIGMSDLINNSSKAEGESNRIAEEYVKLFYNKEANGEAYSSSYNDIERGVFAHVNRSVIGTKERVKNVFDKRKQEVLDAIKLLNDKGNDSESEIAKLLEKVYDKVLDGSENIDDVRKKTDINNVNGVEFWVNKWSDKFNALSDLALNFYNKKLQRDLGYTPDRVRKLQDKTEDVDLDDMQSQFFTNTDEILYDKKSGSLMDKQENRNVPKDMYIDFSFDKKNTNAMYDALTDLYTAYDIRKVGSFLKSDNFRKIFPSKKDANLIDKRIKKFVRLTRRKMPYIDSETSNLIKYADKIAKIGVSSALASPAQPFKQTIPVMVSTLINAGEIGMGANRDSKFNDWLNGSGYAISNRGAEAQVEINSINKMIEDSASMQKGKALKRLEKLNDKLLKATLVYWDVMVARASFKAYYEQSLKKQGLKSSNIDYSKHEVNKEAANYAQRMVDRQQNISNPVLAGDLYTSKENATKVLVKMLAPFSSFRMNQGARLASDLTTLEYWNTSTKEDKVIAARSIAGYALEAATFRTIQIGYGILLYNIAQAILGKYDDEDEDKFTKNLIKGSAISSFTDTFSPIPFGDPFLQDFTAEAFEAGQSLLDIPEDKRIEIFKSKEQSAVKILGTYGIPIQRVNEIFELGRLAYTKEYTDNYGNKKQISDKDAEALKIMITPLIASSVVIGPDVANVARRMAKMAKQGKTISQEELTKRQEKIEALKEVINQSNDRDVESAAREMIKEMKETDPDKLMEIEERKKGMKELKESLLIDPKTGIEYDNPSDLKKYNEPLWEKNFGEGSKWYKEHEGEAEAKSLMNKVRKKEEEEEYGYIKKKKRKGRFGIDRYRR